MSTQITNTVSMDTMARMMNKARECNQQHKVLTVEDLKKAANDYTYFGVNFGKLAGEVFQMPAVIEHYKEQEDGKNAAAEALFDSLQNISSSLAILSNTFSVELSNAREEVIQIKLVIEKNADVLKLKVSDAYVKHCVDQQNFAAGYSYPLVNAKSIEDFQIYKENHKTNTAYDNWVLRGKIGQPLKTRPAPAPVTPKPNIKEPAQDQWMRNGCNDKPTNPELPGNTPGFFSKLFSQF